MRRHRVRLTALVDEIGAVPCRTSDPEAWWPDRRDLDSSATRLAVRGGWRCPARAPCLADAEAADEHAGVWGATLPDELAGSALGAGLTRTVGREALSDGFPRVAARRRLTDLGYGNRLAVV